MMICIVGWGVATVVVLWMGQRGAGWAAAGLYVGMIALGWLDCDLLAGPGDRVTWIAFGWFACMAYFGALAVLRGVALAAASQAVRWSRSLAIWALMAAKRVADSKATCCI